MYKEFTNILNRVLHPNFDFSQNLDFDQMTIDTIKGIKEMLYKLHTNEQRVAFLKSVFRGFFDDGIDCILYQVNELECTFIPTLETNQKFTNEEYKFLYECLLCLRSIIIEISEESLIYNIDFSEIMSWSWRWDDKNTNRSAPHYIFTYYLAPPQNIQDNNKNRKLSVKQISLIHVYNNLNITRSNADEIAASYGYNSPKSGEGLFQDFIHYTSRANRIGKPSPYTTRKLENKINLFESIIPYIKINERQRAKDEIVMLKNILQNEE